MNSRIKKVFLMALVLAAILFIGIISSTVFFKNDSVVAESELFTVTKNNSSVSYATYDAAEHDSNGTGVTGKVTGAYVRLAAGDTLYYNKVIDVNGKTAEDIISRIIVTPDVIGVADFRELEIRLTDAYDSDNYVVMNTRASNEVTHTAYAKAMANCGQSMGGWEHNSNTFFSGSTNAYGFVMRICFDGNINSSAGHITSLEENSAIFALDYDSLSVHHGRTNNPNTMVCSLEEDFFSPWEGFTTGECFLSVSCSQYSGETANFVVASVYDEKITGVGEFEKSAPEVIIDYSEYDANNIPLAEVNKPYKVLGATAVSPYSSDIAITVSVTHDNTSVKVTNNSVFTPSEPGIYTVTYSAVYDDGVPGSASYDVVAGEVPEITLKLPDEKTVSGFAGNLIEIASPVVEGGSGKVKITPVVSVNGAEIELEGYAFRPVEAGTYSVMLNAEDYIGNTAYAEYSVNITKGNKAVFIDKPSVPKYFISGTSYIIKDYYAYDFTDGSGNKVKTSVTFDDAYAKGKRAVNGEITPLAKTNGDVTTVTYTANLNGYKSYYSVEVPTVVVRSGEEGDYINIENLFYAGENGVAKGSTLTEEGTELLFIKDTSFAYVNPLPAGRISLKFNGGKKIESFDKINFILTDSKDENLKIKLTYNNMPGGLTFSLNDEAKQYKLNAPLPVEGSSITLTYIESEGTVTFNGSNSANVKTYLGGEAFAGFTSGMVYLEIEMEQVTGASINILEVNSKIMKNGKDYIRPTVYSIGEYGGTFDINDVYVIPGIFGVDLVDGQLPVYITVKRPDDSIYVGADGTVYDNILYENQHAVVLDEFGKFSISAVCTDNDGHKGSFSYIVSVVDDEKPVLTIEGRVPTEGKVGETILLPSCSVADNNDGQATARIILRSYNGAQYSIPMDKRSFVPQNAGTYEVVYMATDESGNMIVKSYFIKVTK